MLLGIEIGGTKLQLVHGDDHGIFLKKSRCDVDKKAGAKSIRESIRKTIESIGPEMAGKFGPPDEPIRAAAIGFGGPVDWRTGKVCCSHQIEGWADFELGQWLQDLIGAAVAVENDANTACLGEAMRGAGKGRNPV